MPNRWPTLNEQPTWQGVIRTEPQDFQVEEIPAYLPSGSGEHLMILVEKCDRTTENVIKELVNQTNTGRGQIGHAGMKDRRAVTRQWLSLPASAKDQLADFKLEGVKIIQTGLHGNKLKTGHLKGNRFNIRVRGLDQEATHALVQRSQLVAKTGIPNYFGPQRFGRDGANEQTGRELICGKRKERNRQTLRLMLSALQSALFNDVLAERIKQAMFQKVFAGDLLSKADTGGMFICSEPDIDQARMDAGQVHPTGPMFGPKMRTPQGEIEKMEQDILAAAGLDANAFRKYAKLTRGTRRALRVIPADFKTDENQGSLVLAFSLPAGAYATSVLRELVDYREASK